MEEDKIINYILIYVLVNVILFVLYHFTKKFKIVHRIISIIDNLGFCLIAGIDFYSINHLFVIFVPIILLIAYPLAWGLNRELSDGDVASVVQLKSPFPLKDESRTRLKAGFAHLATFPFYYLLSSWERE
ncbi:hypothetical protein [Treponema sp.]|uniref:hypothetical protein n=1 Tax=Treponema sp. TaxID=166 RepID=UPI00298DAD7E|nr:hypothetical protein [Treponema sp.]MCR5612406.1 hypothetical protein [Treponema sp.]